MASKQGTKLGLMVSKYAPKIHNLTRVATFAQGKTKVSPKHGDRWTEAEDALLTADFKAKVPLMATVAKFADKGWGRSYVALWQHRTDVLHLTGRGAAIAKKMKRAKGECVIRASSKPSTEKEPALTSAYASKVIAAKVEAFKSK